MPHIIAGNNNCSLSGTVGVRLACEDCVGVEGIVMNRWPTSIASFSPKLRGSQHGFGGDGEKGQKLMKIIEFTKTLSYASSNQLAANFVVSDFRNDDFMPISQ